VDGLDAGTFVPYVKDDEEHGGWRPGTLNRARELLARIDDSNP
jgi:hypothetical protein